MCQSTPKSIIIVDRSRTHGYRLRNSLLETEFTAHVFNAFAPALALLQSKKIDTVVVEFDTDKPTVDFCEAVRGMGVPVVFSSGRVEPHDLRQYGFDIVSAAPAPSPDIVLQGTQV
jgi:DNA-binding response OmpR family regulator